MSKRDYPDYEPGRPRKHRVTVGDATFIVTSNVNGNTRWIREVHHVRRHRSGSSADVCIYPNGGRKPSATLASLWAHLGIDPDAQWKECAADHPAFPSTRSIRTAMDAVDDARMGAAATAALLAAGWTWVADGAGRWDAPTAQGIDLSGWELVERDGGIMVKRIGVASTICHADEEDANGPEGVLLYLLAKQVIDQRDAAPGVGNG
ncbi:hypothetical protein [Stenotrophomonas sp. GZD-301]|uniref:hypothetical protein n=1 Tax=Stenotrophomonas sp. GZD-301 TaxID=3404814 RepID=UPI003BB67D63